MERAAMGDPMTQQQCSEFERLAQGAAEDLAVLAEHARECPTCAEKLALWDDISRVSRELQEKWESPELWPRIKIELQDEAHRKQRRRFGLPAILQIAAALVLLIGLGAVVWRSYQARNAGNDKYILREAAVEEVKAAEKAHLRSIANLEKVTEPRLAETSDPLLVSYREKLMLLDDAILECQTNIEKNRYNTHLRKELLAMYKEKQNTLRQVMSEESHETSH
jgi:hypothetical protein